MKRLLAGVKEMCVRLAGEVGRVSSMRIESEVGIIKAEPHIYCPPGRGGRFVVIYLPSAERGTARPRGPRGEGERVKCVGRAD